MRAQVTLMVRQMQKKLNWISRIGGASASDNKKWSFNDEDVLDAREERRLESAFVLALKLSPRGKN